MITKGNKPFTQARYLGVSNNPDKDRLHEGKQYIRCIICGRWRSKYVKIDESGSCPECTAEFPTKQSLAKKP